LAPTTQSAATALPPHAPTSKQHAINARAANPAENSSRFNEYYLAVRVGARPIFSRSTEIRNALRQGRRVDNPPTYGMTAPVEAPLWCDAFHRYRFAAFESGMVDPRLSDLIEDQNYANTALGPKALRG
jgi:hypothetical protein